MLGLQTGWSFSLLGPLANGGDAWQIQANGFNPLPVGNPFGFTGGLLDGPKNIGEEYRHNTPVMYYTFDNNFLDFFGASGTNAVAGAFNILNSLTNVDSYSSSLSEFPLNTLKMNYLAQTLSLYDVKSMTLAILLEQLGLADPVRYSWVLHARWHVGNVACPVGENYLVTERNFDIAPSPLNQLQYSPYVNGSFYTYSIFEYCGSSPPSPLTAAAVAFPADALNDNRPVASGEGLGWLPLGCFYTGLTRDDVAGLRYLLRAANVNTETAAAGSLLQGVGYGGNTVLYTSSLTTLAQSALTNSPAVLSNLFPGLIITSSSNYFTTVTNVTVVPYLIPPGVLGNPPTLAFSNIVTILPATNYVYTFGNVVTNSYHTTTSAQLVTVGVMPPFVLGNAPQPFTNTTTVTLNVPSGEYYIIPPGLCGYNIINPQPSGYPVPLVTATTNFVAGATNAPDNYYVQTLVTYSTTHAYVAQPIICTNTPGAIGNYEGIENIQFIMVDWQQFDSTLGQFYTPITNTYIMALHTNGVVILQTFQRVVTAPDFLFSATDQTDPASGAQQNFSDTLPVFNQANIGTGLAGPGTINPPAKIIFNKSGPVFVNGAPSFLNGPNYGQGFVYGSFDGTTNDPVVYPNGTSITNLETDVFIQFSPATLPNAANGAAYSVVLSATGGQPAYTWSLATNSPGLPAGLTLSPGGVISGIPTQNGVYDFMIQMMDSASPTHTVRKNYFITIY